MIALYDLIKRIDQQKVVPFVLCFYKNGYTAQLETIPGCRVYYLKADTQQQNSAGKKKLSGIRALIALQLNAVKHLLATDKKTSAEISNIIRKAQIDIVHHNNDIFLHRDCIRACVKSGVKQVMHNRSLTRYGNDPLMYLSDFFLTRKVNRCIAISQSVKAHFRRMYLLQESYAMLLPDFIDSNTYVPAPPDDHLKHALGIAAGEFVITCIGRITYWKGQHVLLEAVRMLAKQYPQIKVLLVGPEDEGVGSVAYKESLQEIVADAGLVGRVVFAGNRTDIPGIINLSDVIVHCSVKPEPLGMVILEGLLCRKPVIASKGGGSGELIEKYGAIPCMPGDAGQLAQLLGDRIQTTCVDFVDEQKYRQLLHDTNPEQYLRQLYQLYSTI